ncbi:MAG: iron ABC transporter permease [Salaquimonas sp.]
MKSIFDIAGTNTKRSQRLRPYGAVGHLWIFIAGFILTSTMLPMGALLWKATGSSEGVWPHLIANVLPQSVSITIYLLVGVGLGTFVLGAGSAWLVSRYAFPMRGILQWALILPLAIPTYISAYTWVEFADYTGPLQEWVRVIGGYETSRDYWFPEIRSLSGAVLLISLVLFPYVYLPARLSFSQQSRHLFDVARLLGAGPWRLFFKVALPAARPAIAVGVILALMETLNDIGAVEYLGIRTLTFSVFDTWLNRSSLAGAAQLALILMIVVLALVLLERHMRRQQSYHDTKHTTQSGELIQLSGVNAALAFTACALPVLLGFLVPLGQLLEFIIRIPRQASDNALLVATGNSITIALVTAVICVLAGFALIFSNRLSRNKFLKVSIRFSVFGYAVPGTILAIGVLVALTGFDNWFSGRMVEWFGMRTGLLISGSVAIIIFACSVRFLAVAVGNIEAGYAKLSPNLIAASRTLGHSQNSSLWRVELPLISKSMAVAGVLVFVETMKELSSTLMLRPFNFDTLATYVYSRASRALFEEASLAALIIVLIGLIPVYVLTKVIILEQKR